MGRARPWVWDATRGRTRRLPRPSAGEPRAAGHARRVAALCVLARSSQCSFGVETIRNGPAPGASPRHGLRTDRGRTAGVRSSQTAASTTAPPLSGSLARCPAPGATRRQGLFLRSHAFGYHEAPTPRSVTRACTRRAEGRGVGGLALRGRAEEPGRRAGVSGGESSAWPSALPAWATEPAAAVMPADLPGCPSPCSLVHKERGVPVLGPYDVWRGDHGSMCLA